VVTSGVQALTSLMTGIERCSGRDGPDMRGPCVSGREREGGLVEDATQNSKCIPRSAPRALRLTGSGEGVAAYGERVGRCGRLARLGRTLGKIQIRV
jgi:hypothetical protein